MRAATAVPDLEAWRTEARALLAANVPPTEVVWQAAGGSGLLFDPPAPAAAVAPTASVPRKFVRLATYAVLHRAVDTHALLYRVLWRLTHGERDLVEDAVDSDIRLLVLRAGQVRRDEHKMHAFVRFKEVEGHFVAWYAPDHHVVELVAPFFRERFHGMQWTILTPDRSVSWDGSAVSFGPGVPRHAAPAPDEFEDMWRTYYASVFNPARANKALMRQHMPARFWPQLPEAQLIPDLLARATPRVEAMIDPASQIAARIAATAQPITLPVLRDAARGCTACELCEPATQTVFGEGPADAQLVLVGEQPGDEEDLRGRPFVGPAGRVLDAALADVGIDRAQVYLTNAVKHFRFEPRGKKRLHQRPTAEHSRTCKPWLGAELQVIQPRVVVCLGATAAQSLIGSRFRVSEERGKLVETHWAPHLLATHHPAAILRVEEIDRPRYAQQLRDDLAFARTLLGVEQVAHHAAETLER